MILKSTTINNGNITTNNSTTSKDELSPLLSRTVSSPRGRAENGQDPFYKRVVPSRGGAQANMKTDTPSQTYIVILQWNAKGFRSIIKLILFVFKKPGLITLPLKVRKLNFFLNSNFQVSKECLVIPQLRLGEVLLFFPKWYPSFVFSTCCRPP